MAKLEVEKRPLKFNDFDELIADVQTLANHGYESKGNWTLGQACGHIADWMRFPMDGFPKPPMVMRIIFWFMKVTVGPSMKRKIMKDGFKGGMPTAPETVPDAVAYSDSDGVEKLKETINRLSGYAGELLPSPLFGPMDKETLVKVSLLHAEHHLGYLEPKE